MIRNIIFDIVGVLMRFDTESYIEEHHLSEADVAILRKEVFRSLEWARQDRGSISTQEAERRIMSAYGRWCSIEIPRNCGGSWRRSYVSFSEIESPRILAQRS